MSYLTHLSECPSIRAHTLNIHYTHYVCIYYLEVEDIKILTKNNMKHCKFQYNCLILLLLVAILVLEVGIEMRKCVFIDITNIFVNMTDFSCHLNQKDALRIPDECLFLILT